MFEELYDKALREDVRAASLLLTPDEVRFLVDRYYQMQDRRKAGKGQIRSEEATGEPNLTLKYLTEADGFLETRIKAMMDAYTDTRRDTRWMKSLYGVGPVIAAGLVAHIDITRAKTAGAIWRYFGLDPSVTWEPHTKRPWNATAKTLAWCAGQCFMKFSNAPQCFYGPYYKQRKAIEVERNNSGANAEAAAAKLATLRIRDEYTIGVLQSGKLLDGQVDARARRWVVKLFLSHVFDVMFECHYGSAPPRPYSFDHLGHVHFIAPPQWPCE